MAKKTKSEAQIRGAFRMPADIASVFDASVGMDTGETITPKADPKKDEKKRKKSDGKATLLVLLPRIPLLQAVIGYIAAKLYFGSNITLIPVFCQVVPDQRAIEQLKKRQGVTYDPVWIALGEAIERFTFVTTDTVKALGDPKRLMGEGWSGLLEMSQLEKESGTYSDRRLFASIGRILLFAYFFDTSDNGVLQVFMKAVAVLETHLYKRRTRKVATKMTGGYAKIAEGFGRDVSEPVKGTLPYALRQMFNASKSEEEAQELIGFWMSMRRKINDRFGKDKEERKRFEVEWHTITDRLPLVIMRNPDYFEFRRFSNSMFLHGGRNCQMAIVTLANGGFVIQSSAAFRHDMRNLVDALNGVEGKEKDHGAWQLIRIGRGHYLVTNGGFYGSVRPTRRTLEQVLGEVLAHVTFLGSRPKRRERAGSDEKLAKSKK